jgi:hypothetical protein
MNKLIIFIGLILVQTAGQTWGASYLLHLKNGNELRTSYYWEEDEEIKFFIYGGVAGIQKGFVTKVTLSDWNECTRNAFRLKVARDSIFRVQGILRPW